MENPIIDPGRYSQLIFDKGVKVIQWSKNQLSKKQLDIHMRKKKNLYADLYPSQELTQSGSQT